MWFIMIPYKLLELELGAGVHSYVCVCVCVCIHTQGMDKIICEGYSFLYS